MPSLAGVGAWAELGKILAKDKFDNQKKANIKIQPSLDWCNLFLMGASP